MYPAPFSSSLPSVWETEGLTAGLCYETLPILGKGINKETPRGL